MAALTPELIESFRSIAASIGIDVKGAKMPYTSINGHMFSFLSPEGMLNIRLSEADRQNAMKTYKAEQAVQHGAILREYIVLPHSIFRKQAIVTRLLIASRDYVSTLNPKSTTRKSNRK